MNDDTNLKVIRLPQAGFGIGSRKCKRCAHEWTPKAGNLRPKYCPNCRSSYWDREPIRKTARKPGVGYDCPPSVRARKLDQLQRRMAKNQAAVEQLKEELKELMHEPSPSKNQPQTPKFYHSPVPKTVAGLIPPPPKISVAEEEISDTVSSFADPESPQTEPLQSVPDQEEEQVEAPPPSGEESETEE